MPLEKDMIDRVLGYCDAHLSNRDWLLGEFSFIEYQELQERLALEFQAARYVYKLGEALAVDGERLHAHVKFQIVQYASIYEAVIVYLLWSKFSSHPAVTDIEFHETYRSASAWPTSLNVTNADGEAIHLCCKRKEKTPRISIKFDDKVDAAVKIGFISAGIGDEIKVFYKLRNAIHIESAVKNGVQYELDQSLLAYRRMRPFIDGIKAFLAGLPTPQVEPQVEA